MSGLCGCFLPVLHFGILSHHWGTTQLVAPFAEQDPLNALMWIHWPVSPPPWDENYEQGVHVCFSSFLGAGESFQGCSALQQAAEDLIFVTWFNPLLFITTDLCDSLKLLFVSVIRITRAAPKPNNPQTTTTPHSFFFLISANCNGSTSLS